MVGLDCVKAEEWPSVINPRTDSVTVLLSEVDLSKITRSQNGMSS